MKKSTTTLERTRKTKTAPKNTTARKKQTKATSRPIPRTILVPIDFSNGSERALDFAASLAPQFDSQIVLVHVIDPLHAPGRFDSSRLRSLRAEALEEAKARIAKFAADHAPSSEPLKYHVLDGTVHTAILDFVRKARADWIIMGSKGQTGMKRLLAGSVAENVVRHARCPVLVIP